ncbi:MAG: FAD binding domain-containing protein [Bryobacteraceae bacterium]
MRSAAADYELAAARTLPEALTLVGDGWKPIAGGTDLMVLFEAGKLDHRRLVSLRGLAELHGIEISPEGASLGALTTYTDVRRHDGLARDYPLLAAAASETGGIATQNRGTIGGNIVNASPAADTPPALLVYEAALELVSAGGARQIPYLGFHTGYKRMQLAPGEILSRVLIPAPAPGARHYYRKTGTRRAQAISKVVMAGLLWSESGRVRDARIALGSVAPTVIRCVATESLLRGRMLDAALIAEAQAALAGEISPVDDLRSTARYRRRVAQNLLAEFLGPSP